VAQGSTARDAAVLAAPGTRLAIEVAGVPLGDYTRQMLQRMERIAGAGFAHRAMTNVVAEEQLVDDVAARLLSGDADAAVLYATDVAARAPRLRAIEVPPGAQVAATYVACVTTATSQRAAAAAWIDELLTPSSQAIMRSAGFAAPPQVSRRG
jgi:molybdate transport system substrate-binding protein